jgi:hypothetical protein
VLYIYIPGEGPVNSLAYEYQLSDVCKASTPRLGFRPILFRFPPLPLSSSNPYQAASPQAPLWLLELLECSASMLPLMSITGRESWFQEPAISRENRIAPQHRYIIGPKANTQYILPIRSLWQQEPQTRNPKVIHPAEISRFTQP